MNVEEMNKHQALREKCEKFETALNKINVIRDSIIATQSLNWSEHAYPLVAALNEAGFTGLPYDEGRKNYGTLFERLNSAEAQLANLKFLGIPVVLHCPLCKVQHIDQLEEDGTDWATRPHRKHLCAACKHVWQPYPVGTYGVAV